MRRVMLMMLLAVVSSNAFAEWREVGTNDGQTTYANPSIIRKAGNRVEMWHLLDFNTTNTANSKTYLSLKVKSEYDCNKVQSRSLYTSAHKGNMGKGEVVGIESGPEEWKPIPLGSAKEYLFYIACRKK